VTLGVGEVRTWPWSYAVSGSPVNLYLKVDPGGLVAECSEASGSAASAAARRRSSARSSSRMHRPLRQPDAAAGG